MESSTSRRGRVRGWCLDHPRRALALVLALALAFHAPSLATGLYFDDFPHQLVLEGWEASHASAWSLFDFGDFPRPGHPAHELGVFPWWTSEDWSVHFFRPLTSLSIALDQRLFGHFEIGYHFTSLAWFAVALALVHAVFRALDMGIGASLLGVLVLGLEDSSALPAGWTANRNSLIELSFQLAAVLVVLRAARPSGTAAQAGALVLALCAALAKESGVSAFVLVALATLWRARSLGVPSAGTRRIERRSWIAASIACACALVYVGCLIGAGYGARSGFYPVPWHSAEELRTWSVRALLLVVGSPAALSSPLSLDLLFVLPEVGWFYVPILCAASALLAAILWARLKHDPRLGFFAAWWLATLLPQAGAATSDRLLFNSAVASSGLIALALAGPWTGWTRRPCGLLALSTTALSAAALLAVQWSLLVLGREARGAVLQAELPALLESRAGRDALVLQVPNGLVALSPIATWAWHHPEEPLGTTRFWVLQAGPRALAWRVLDAHTFELESLDEPFAARPFESVYLAPGDRAEVGRIWHTALFTVEALAVEGGFPRAIRVHCERALDDGGLVFLAWNEGRWQAVAPPPAGGAVALERARGAAPIAP